MTGRSARSWTSSVRISPRAGVAQLAERQPSKLNVASSNLVSRSKPSAASLGVRSDEPETAAFLGKGGDDGPTQGAGRGGDEGSCQIRDKQDAGVSGYPARNVDPATWPEVDGPPVLLKSVT
jgi:hypothetical protein